jgi:hypothetical protein
MNERVVELVLRYEELCKQGQSVTPEELCGDSPELLAEVRLALARLRGVDAFLGTPGATSAGTLPQAPRREAKAPAWIGAYEVLGVLGQGGMGVVYQARHASTQQLVAVKLLRDNLGAPNAVIRFRTEAEALARVRHPHIVQLLETGEHEGLPFLVMELVAGGSLGQATQGSPVEPNRCAEQVEALARAIDVAHQAGVIHRDLKPSNVLLTAEGVLKISDFGLAKRLDVDLRQTASGAILGTPSYMSPEQAAGLVRQIGPASDVWSLGVMLYEMLTGRLPFAGASPYQTLQQVCEKEPVPPRQIEPSVPRDLETICLKCLQKDAARRYAGAAELADDLRRYLEDRPIRARPVGLGERLLKWRRRNAVLSALLAVGLLFLAVGGAAGLWYWDRYRRVRVEYFAALTSRFGVKEGVGRLSEAEAKRRRFSYKVYRRAGRVERVDVVDGQGELTTEHQTGALLQRANVGRTELLTGRECRFEYARNERGGLTEERAYDRLGNVVWVLSYSGPDTAFYANKEGTPEAPAGQGGGPAPGAATGFAQARTRSGGRLPALPLVARGPGRGGPLPRPRRPASPRRRRGLRRAPRARRPRPPRPPGILQQGRQADHSRGLQNSRLDLPLRRARQPDRASLLRHRGQARPGPARHRPGPPGLRRSGQRHRADLLRRPRQARPVRGRAPPRRRLRRARPPGRERGLRGRGQAHPAQGRGAPCEGRLRQPGQPGRAGLFRRREQAHPGPRRRAQGDVRPR